MKQFVVVLVSMLILVSCLKKQEEKEVCTDKEKKFEMYELSEMAMLMEQMYAHNQQLRERIIKNDTIGKFPDFFTKIYDSKFTTPSDDDAFFKENANKFIETQKNLFADDINLKEDFNKTVDACITCHQGKCGLVIPRIKKLYIK